MNKSRLMGAMCACLSIVSLNAISATFDNHLVPIGNDHLQSNSVSNTFINDLTVNGRWFLNATSLSTDMFFDGTQTVGGAGEIILSDSANNRWLGDTTNTITVGSDLTVRGAGKIGLNLPNIINNGTFLAQGSSAELLIQTSSFTNNGILRAEGAQGLHLSGVNLTNNTSVDVDSGSALQLTHANVDGVFNIANSATATASSTLFDAVTINGDMQQNNFTSNTFENGLTLNGAWNLNATSGTTDMGFQGTQSIGGVGEIVMSDNANNRISGNLNALTVGSDITIRGAGKIGLNLTNIINNGEFLAQGSTAELLIQSTSFTNDGVLRAEGSKGLHLSGVNLTNNTSVDVNTGSALQIDSSTVNGIFNIAAGANASAEGSTLDAVTINGDMQQNNFTSNTFENGLTLNGAWNLNATSGTTDMGFQGTQSIGGVGEIVMSDNANNRISGNLNALTVGSDITIRGAGKIGLNLTNIINNGEFLAQGSNAELRIQSSALTNNGVLRAEGSKGMNITSGSFTTSGLVEVAIGSQLTRAGTYVQTDGQTNVDGVLQATGLIDIQGGKLSGKGQINGDISNAGTIGPGNSPGLLSIDGVYSQSASGILAIELGGLSAGTEYDVLDITGTANLAGTLDVDLFDLGGGLFSPTLGDTFDILFAETIAGEFDILSLAGLGNGLGWDVSYILDDFGDDVVQLSVQAVPIPAAVWLFGSGLLGLMGIARRRKEA